jgi:co-chaperonin GroES (HSP10)
MTTVPTAPNNHLFVLIDKMYADEIKAGTGVKLFMDSSFKPEWNATITGHVVSTPVKLTQDIVNYERRGLDVEDVRPGDEVIFKYMVVEDKDHVDSEDGFWLNGDPQTEDKEKEFKNHRGELLRIFTLGKNWYAASLQDREGNILGGVNGTRADAEKFMMQFKFLGDGEVSFKNLMIHEGVMYWRVDYSLVMGVIRQEEQDGKKVPVIHPARGYVFVEPFEIDLGDMTEGGIIIPEYMQKQKSRRMGIARHVGKPRKGDRNLSLQKDEFVVYDEKYVEQYEILGQLWLVIQHKYIEGKLV